MELHATRWPADSPRVREIFQKFLDLSGVDRRDDSFINLDWRRSYGATSYPSLPRESMDR